MIAIRVNTLRSNSEAVLEALGGLDVKPVPFSEHAFVVVADMQDLQKRPEYHAGAFYIQSLSSQLPALILDPQPGERILDMCAAPGSKTTQLAALMHNEGEIVANDSSRERCFKLRALLDRYGVTNTKVITEKGEFLWRKYADSFDRVLVDAPCSMDLDKSDKEIKALARQQTYLLRSAISCTKPGGTIVYSTCTSDERENERVVEWILENVEGVKLEPITELLPEWKTKEGYLRIKAQSEWESFFVTRFRRL